MIFSSHMKISIVLIFKFIAHVWGFCVSSMYWLVSMIKLPNLVLLPLHSNFTICTTNSHFFAWYIFHFILG